MKVLIFRFSAIGDIVLTSPVIRCLAKQQNAEIHYVTKAAFADIPAQNPGVRKVIALGKLPLIAHPKAVYAHNMTTLTSRLREERYDYVIDLHHNLRTLQLKTALGAPGYSFNKLNIEKWLMVNLKINRLPDQHIVHRYMETVKPLGVEYDGKGLDFYMPSDTGVRLNMALATNGVEPEGQKFIAFVIGATHFTKRLPEEKIIAICKNLPLPVVLLGGQQEAPGGDRIAAACGHSVINLCGKLSIFESGEMVRRSEKVITHDTGLMHIAAAYRKKIVAVWGNTIPAFGMSPFYPDGFSPAENIEIKDLSCRPCSKIGFKSCPKGHFKCMNNIDPERITSIFNR